MKCEECGSKEWKLVWYGALIEEGQRVNLYQCRKCKAVVMDTDEYKIYMNDSSNEKEMYSPPWWVTEEGEKKLEELIVRILEKKPLGYHYQVDIAKTLEVPELACLLRLEKLQNERRVERLVLNPFLSTQKVFWKWVAE